MFIIKDGDKRKTKRRDTKRSDLKYDDLVKHALQDSLIVLMDCSTLSTKDKETLYKEINKAKRYAIQNFKHKNERVYNIVLRSNNLSNSTPTKTSNEYKMQDEDKNDDTYNSNQKMSLSNPIPKKKKKKATNENNPTKFYKYVLGKVVDDPIINSMEETSYFLKQLLTKDHPLPFQIKRSHSMAQN